MFKFSDGTDTYNEFNKKYIRHETGNVILAPPGSGKTTYINKQKGDKKNWIDSDDLFGINGLNIGWENTTNETLAYLRADYMLEQSKLYGYKIIGALFYKYIADAVVIIPLDQHIIYTSLRNDLDNYNINYIRKIFMDHAITFKIPVFNSIHSAIQYLDNKC